MAAVRCFALDPTLLFQNGQRALQVSPGDGPPYWNVGNGARWKWRTSAREIRIYGFATAAGLQQQDSALGVLVNDLPYFFTPPATINTYFQTAGLYLPPGKDKVVELVVPAAGALKLGQAPKGVYPISVTFDQPATAIKPSLRAQHLVIYGDSITSGSGSAASCLFGWAPLLQRSVSRGGFDGTVTLVSYGYRTLNDDCSSQLKTAAFVSGISSLCPTKILVAIGSNDWALSVVSLKIFSAYYNVMLDEFRSQMPSVSLICLSPIRRGKEGSVNFFGNTLQDFRQAVADAVAARSRRSAPPAYIDGLPIFPDLTNFTSGLTHPTTVGHRIMHDYIAARI